ncbi:ATP-binding protein [Pseudomonas zhanjiangensis]|uniref:histidine kinase n=1 Tax=Pseudomonas zhanjiangensis TaxID=3239015 RepID=A0ABV3Z2P4_9PSED
MPLRQSQLAAALIEHIEIGVIILDSALRIQHWNPFISRCSGKNLDLARQQLLTSAFPEAETPRFEQMVARAREHGEHVYTLWRDNPYLIQLPYDAVGNPTPLMLQSTLFLPFRDQDGQRLFGLLVYDATDVVRSKEELNAAVDALNEKQVEQDQLLKKLEKINTQLLQSEKLAAIGQLAAGVAHEINNPIGYVFSNLKTLAGYVHDLFRIIDSVDTAASLEELRHLKRQLEYDYIRSDADALIGESEDGIDRVKKIISSLKDFSHVDDEEFRLSDLHRGLDTTLNVVNNEIKYKAEIVKEYGDLPQVECIPSQINQVLMNLLVNASHSIEEFGRITLRSGYDNDWVWLEVEDTGSGIPPHTLKRIFEPFFTTKPVGQGTGLGLALSYSIMQKHHGSIEVSSELGQGTRFRLWLPISQPPAVETESGS